MGLHIDTSGPIDYDPGHVLALEIQQPDNLDEESKAYKDAKANGGWMRGPYTVSRATESSLDILIKVVGDKSKHFATSKPGTELKFGGKFKVPILKGISKESTKRIVLISTGVGVGPCIGAIEKALQQEENDFPPISLLASYRTDSEVVYKEHLDELQRKHPKSFSWKSIVTSKEGRLSASDDNLKLLQSNSDDGLLLEETHYHLIGNGQLVQEFQAGLRKAGVPDDKVTVEMYFNHKAAKDMEAVDRISEAVTEMARSSTVAAN